MGSLIKLFEKYFYKFELINASLALLGNDVISSGDKKYNNSESFSCLAKQLEEKTR